MDSGQQPPSMSSAVMKTSDQDQFQIGAQINQPWPQPPGPTHYNDYVDSGQPPSVGDMRPVVPSHPSGSRDLMSIDGQPPSLNDVGGRRASQTGGTFAGGNQIIDQQALVGVSLNGGNFKKMYPMAYQK